MSQSVFGQHADIHPVTHMPLENGSGALPPDQQAQIHCDVIEQKQGKAAGDEMREKVRAYITGEHDGEAEFEQLAKED